MNSHVNFLLFLNQKISLKIKLELSNKARQDCIEYYKKKYIFIKFSYNQNITFQFNSKSYPVILINNCKDILVSEKFHNFFFKHKSIIAVMYVFESIGFSTKLFEIIEKEKNKRILAQEISIFEKAIVFIADRKKKNWIFN